MERTRSIAKALMREGVIEITQKGERVAVDAFKGPIRLRLAENDVKNNEASVERECSAQSKRAACEEDENKAVKAREAKRSKPGEPRA